jgi:DNA-binding CsgD family transcriptional regulator
MTGRQQQILELAAKGESDKQIALALGISIHTVRSHLQRLYRTGGLSNRAEAVAAWLGQDSAQPAAQLPIVVPREALAEQEERVSEAAALSAAAQLPIQIVKAPGQLELINQERLNEGLAPLEWDDSIAMIAELSARRMADRGHLDTVIVAVPEIDGRPVQAENVGYWSGVNDVQLHALFAADPKQRANILGAHGSMGAAWALTEAGVAFLSVVFA